MKWLSFRLPKRAQKDWLQDDRFNSKRKSMLNALTLSAARGYEGSSLVRSLPKFVQTESSHTVRVKI